ncbi:MAG: ATP-binding protein [Ghiorsea sp.]|nr:ATP-binding protein [Ghiorsea sp.]
MSDALHRSKLRPLVWVPFVVAVLLLTVSVLSWPSHDQFGPIFLNWLTVFLFFSLGIAFFILGICRLKSTREVHAGSYLRTKLVAAMVLMVLIPSLLLQLTANQVIEKGLDVWFDVRVDTLLDKAMSLAQGFYSDVESDMELSLSQVAQDDDFPLEIASKPLGTMIISQHLGKLLNQYGWHKVELFDVSERLLAVASKQVAGQQFSDLKVRDLSDMARLSKVLGEQAVEHEVRDSGEYVVGYLPLYMQQRFVALLRAEIRLPDDVTLSARSIEADYKSYRELERHRQGIQEIFTHTLMIAMLLITCIAGLLALFFARKLTTPIEELALALKKVETGEFDVLVPVHAEDELGSLARSFNSMTAKLRQNMAMLQQTQKELTGALVNSRQRQYVLENLLANLQSGVILLDENGDVRLMNQACQTLLVIPESTQKKVSIFDFSEVYLAPVLNFFRTLETQGLDSLQHEIELLHGFQTIKILARGTVLGKQEDQLFSGWLLVFDDVTQLAEAQKHQAWSEVAQRLAHEIKNPLTPIKLSTERLQRRFRAQVDNVAVFDTCTKAVITQVERLQRLLADFSNLATLPKPRTEVVSIRSLLQDLRELYSAYQNVTFEGLPEGEVCCDPDQVRQVLINLIDNALATDDLVRIYVEVTEDDTKFYVQDEGAGIDEKTQKHMFEPYFSTKRDGSGLGLAIAQRITEEHDGTLKLVSTGAPTRFCMCLPHKRIRRGLEEEKA